MALKIFPKGTLKKGPEVESLSESRGSGEADLT
jgi:hypothetical protein